MVVVAPETLNNLMDLQDDAASFFLSSVGTNMSGETYWTCVETLAQTKLAELKGEVQYTENQRFEVCE